MASIKKIQERKFKITVSNGYHPDGRKISRAKTITVPDSVGKRGISQYVFHAAEEWERVVKNGFCEDAETPFEEYAQRWSSTRGTATSLFCATYWPLTPCRFPHL